MGRRQWADTTKRFAKSFFLFYICLRILKIVGSYVQQRVNIFVSFVLLCVFCLSVTQTLNMNANYFVSNMLLKRTDATKVFESDKLKLVTVTATPSFVKPSLPAWHLLCHFTV